MELQSPFQYVLRARLAAPAAACLCAGLGVYAVAIRLFEAVSGADGTDGAVTVPATSLGMLLAAAALALLDAPAPWRRLAAVAALGDVAIGGVALGTTTLGWMGHDLLATARWWAKAPSPFTALCLVLLGAATFLLAAGRARRSAIALAAIALAITLSAGVGHLYGASRLYGMTRWGGMAITTAAGLGAIAIGLLLRDPTRGPAALYLSDGSGGQVLRRVTPAILIGPLALGWLVQAGIEQNMLDADYALALLLVGLIFLLATVLLRTARVLNRLDARLAASLDQEQAARRAAEVRRTELERINDSRARLIRGFSHDVRTPLSTAQMHAWLLARQVAGTPEAARIGAGVDGIQRAIDTAVELTNGLLGVAVAEAGDVPVERVSTPLCSLVEDVTDSFRVAATERRLALDLRCAGSMQVDTDPARVRQILMNLLSNALKFTEEGRVAVEVRAPAPDGPGPGQWARIDVADTGPGIADAEKELVFLEFTRLEPGHVAGSGIGLSISRHLARRLGGDITLDDAPGGGSVFTLWLPLAMTVPAATSPL